MAKTPANAVQFTGAKFGDILIGIIDWNLNHGMRLKIHRPIEKNCKGGPIPVPITLLCAGDGKYAKQLRPHESKYFKTTEELSRIILATVDDPKPVRIHIFNANTLEKEIP